MPNRRALAALLTCLGTLCLAAPFAAAQTSPEIVRQPWSEKSWGETYDRLLYQDRGHVQREDAAAQVFWWESTGRFRFNTTDPRPFVLGYRWATMDFDTVSSIVPHHLDDISLAAGIPLSDSADGRFSAVLGAGYSSNTPFADINGLYGIGHLVYERPLSTTDSLFLTLNYNGNSALLPDVPLPGFAYVRRTETYAAGVGFPDSWLEYHVAPRLTFSASYAVPYTGDVKLEYGLTEHVSVFGGYSNFFNPFELDGQPTTRRLFFQMSRAEVGIRYGGTIKGFTLDVALTAGYAFEQNFYRGFDVRDLDSVASLSDKPYIGLQLVGRF